MYIERFEPFIARITQGVSEIVGQYYRQGDFAVEVKADNSPVTVADREIEEFFRAMVAREYPSHSVLGEEFGSSGGDNGGDGGSGEYEWVIDPIDGTKSFIHGVPLFATLIALLRDKRPVLGVCYNPVLGDLLVGDNRTCLHNGRQVVMRACSSLSEATILTTDILAVGKYRDQAKFDSLARRCKLCRTWGDAYGYFLLATGSADIMVDPLMSPWDSLPLIPIINGAGGVITDWSGGDPVGGNTIVAAAPGIHAQVIEALN